MVDPTVFVPRVNRPLDFPAKQGVVQQGTGMAIYDSKSETARGLKGVHLYHFALSNCSQRCRFALELRGVDWTSHHLDIAKREHLTRTYREINPNGVVPTLVHDGVVVLESNDIISYIDERFPGSGFMPQDTQDVAAVKALLASSGDVQNTMKTLSHEYLFSARRRQISSMDIAEMQEAGASESLTSFLTDFIADGKAWAARLNAAHSEIKDTVQQLEERLNVSGLWLSGPSFGLADMSWAVNYYRLAQCQMPFANAMLYEAWGSRIVEMPEFRRAVVNYRPE